MNPLSGLFGAGVAVRNALYNGQRLRQNRLKGPVVSIGNLCVGGTGKTPFTQVLGDLLMARGIAFDVLSRGYGRSSTEIAVVDPNGRPRQFGDEPLLLANYFAGKWKGEEENAPKVVVGSDRYEAGRFAERTFGPRIHLLDDGFQHRRLARDFDVVLLAPDDADQVLLPVGRLREPLSSLRRADAVVAADAVSLAAFPALPQRIWHIERDIVLPAGFRKEQRTLAFCGIARPNRFFHDLRRHGVYPVSTVTFRDHHAYTARDVARIRREMESSRAECCITTIKDMMNLGPLVADLALSVSAASLAMSLRDGESALDEMLRVIEERKASRGDRQ